jgi:hypothetical protein
MFVLYIKIKFEIDMNNNGLLETICEHMKQIKRGGRGRDIIKLILINLHFFYHYSFFSHFQNEASIKFFNFIGLLKYIQ